MEMKGSHFSWSEMMEMRGSVWITRPNYIGRKHRSHRTNAAGWPIQISPTANLSSN